MIFPRHRTLRAAMDWSYALLSEKERTLLRRCAVFAGGWTLEAAEAALAQAGIDIEGGDAQQPSDDLCGLGRALEIAGVHGDDPTPDQERTRGWIESCCCPSNGAT